MVFAWIGILTAVMWYAHAKSDVADLQIIPNSEVIIEGNPTTFVCTGGVMDPHTKSVYVVLGRPHKRKSLTDTSLDFVVSFLDKENNRATDRLQKSRGHPITVSQGKAPGQFITKYKFTKCAYNAYTYGCYNSIQTGGKNHFISGTNPKTLTIVDNDDPVELSDIEKCLGDVNKCATCGLETRPGRRYEWQTSRAVGETINVTCSKSMSFPKGATNTFVWYKRNAKGPIDKPDWSEITTGIQGKYPKATTTPVREDGKCLSKERKHSTLLYVVTNGDGPRLEIRCEVVLVLAGGMNATTWGILKNDDVCVIPGPGGIVTPRHTGKTITGKAGSRRSSGEVTTRKAGSLRPSGEVTGTGKAGSPRPSGEVTTTQKYKGTITGGPTGFSLQSGAGIAAISASCVVVLSAAVVAGVYWVVKRRRRRAEAKPPSRAESQNYYYDDVSQTYNSEYSTYAS